MAAKSGCLSASNPRTNWRFSRARSDIAMPYPLPQGRNALRMRTRRARDIRRLADLMLPGYVPGWLPTALVQRTKACEQASRGPAWS